MAIWVDYQLFDEEDLRIQTWTGDDFVPYEKISVKFFNIPEYVEPGLNFVSYRCEFTVGESDFLFHFAIDR